jgi:hypothetical protein
LGLADILVSVKGSGFVPHLIVLEKTQEKMPGRDQDPRKRVGQVVFAHCSRNPGKAIIGLKMFKYI